MTPTNNALPELPEFGIDTANHASVRVCGYTADQLRAYGELCRASAGREAVACWCQTCRPITVMDCRMVLCPDCGNKRCPHANDHRNACTGSNEPGQKGSAYENFAAPTAPELPKQGEGGVAENGGEVMQLLCWAWDNLNDMPISNEWAAEWCRRAEPHIRALAKKAEGA